MKLIAFRVTMYKGIIDSGWVKVNPLTVLVGKNESGKTSLLRALHKFNPYIPELYKDHTDSYEDYLYQIEGRRAKDKLVKEWLTRYTESQTEVILLGDAVGVSSDFALEDLFPADFITDIVKEAYETDLAAAKVNEIIPRGAGILWRRIERFMEEKDMTINKGPIAKRLQRKLSSMKDASELPDETRQRAIKLFQAVRSAFYKGAPPPS